MTDIRLQIGNARGDNNVEFASIRVLLAGLPTKAALWGMIGATAAIALSVLALVVGILTYLRG